MHKTLIPIIVQQVYSIYKYKQDVQPYDILMVRDGTYLIGTTAMITEQDTKILLQSHLYKIRVHRPDELDPFLLLAILNTPIVKRQIRAKRFTQDIIDTLGKRIHEVILPIPKDKTLRERIPREMREIVLARVELRNRAKQICLEVEGIAEPAEEDKELLQSL